MKGLQVEFPVGVTLIYLDNIKNLGSQFTQNMVCHHYKAQLANATLI
jgi:hypothetical protein